YIEHGDQEYVVRGIGALTSSDDVKRVVIASRHGTPVIVRDVANVTIGEVPRRGAVTRDSGPRECLQAQAGRSTTTCALSNPEAVEGIVLMRKKANPSEVLKHLRAKIAQINSEVLPRGVHVVPFYDRTDLVNTTLHTVGENLAVGAALVVAILLL